MSSDSASEAGPPLGNPEDSGLRDLALRLVPPHYGQSGPSSEPPRIWPGEVPDLPFDLPIPAGARLIGSYGRGPHITVLLDCDDSPKDLVDFCERHMLAVGWSIPAGQRGSGGFVVSQPTQRAYALFCRSAEGPALTVAAQRPPDGQTHGEITINLDPAETPCRPPVEQDQHPAHPTGPSLPPLEALPHCELTGFGTNSFGGVSVALAILTANLDPASILTHYGRQLEEAGWQRTGEATSGPVAWSAWTFTDRDRRPAHGVLTVTREPGDAGSYMLSLHAHAEEPRSPAGGQGR